ncbi:FGGY-family carbohydrate kinase [Candidatus Poribacteria bacterium]|nr:FGGY-family carbohydrate kinase [Candidatus Poribacteria bacterium]
MNEHKYILAFDHGTSGVKTSIISTRGEVVASDFEKTPIYFLPDGGAEQDPLDWWNAALATSKRLARKGVVPAQEIVAVCVSSTFSSTVAVDRDGNHLGNSLTWMDSRGAPYVQKAMSGFPNVMGYGLFKVMTWVKKTAGAPSLSGKDDIAHVLLWKHEFPDIYKKTHMFLPSKDYLNLRLTGQFAASYDSMQLFWVTDTRDINNIRYDDKLIHSLDIDRNKLPPLKASTDVLGTLSATVADEIGLGRDVKVVMGSPDHQCALIGSGAVRDFEGHIYIGTSSWVQCIVPFKKSDVFHAIASFPTAIPGRYQSVNEQDLAGGCLGFLVDNILFHKNGFVASELPENPYKQMDEIASRVPPGSHKLIFTPWLNGERTPVDSTTLRGGLHNISKTTNQDDVVRAFMEGVAYNTRWSLMYVERFVKRKLNPLNMIGGGAKSSVWCQIFADVLNRDIRQVKDPLQANARGAAFIASVGLGHITFADIPNVISYENTYSPNPANRAIYNELFAAFLEIYKNNKRLYDRLNRLNP